MADIMNDLVNGIFAKLGVSSLTDLVDQYPSALNKDAYILAAEKYYENGKMEDAFNKLSLSHSTLLHQHIQQRMHRPNPKEVKDTAATADAEDMTLKMTSLSLTEKDEALHLLQKLPSDWTVVQITVQSNDETHFRKIGSPLPTPPLYIARCSCGPKPTVTLQVVPSPHREGVRGIIQEMGLIKQENKLITKDYRDQQEKYWEKREEMVNRLKCVVRSMDAAWLRYWCCLLLGGLQPRDQKILEDTTTHILSSLKISLTSHQHLLLQCLISCPDPDQRAVSYEGGLTLCLQAGIAAVLGESVRSSRVKDVYNAVKNEKATLDKLRTAERNPIILILDKDIVSLPWEMTWVLQNQAVTRMPSLRMLYILYQHHSCKSDSVLVKGINPNRAFYVLDPENNLPRTRKRLEGILDETGWPGVTAQTPSHEIFKEALSNQDMFVYIGHGSGSKYMPGEIVESAECRAVVLLYGCSSVGLLPNGQIPDPWGAVMNYLVAHCPCVIGMLWDVTDKETDMLTMEMLQTMRGLSTAEGTTMENPPSDLPLLVSQARSKRNWYFSRAALSVYGLPLHIVHNFDS